VVLGARVRQMVNIDVESKTTTKTKKFIVQGEGLRRHIHKLHIQWFLNEDHLQRTLLNLR